MKLKEKLAEEYAEDSGDSTDESAWMAGFEKAREMILALDSCGYPFMELSFREVQNLGEEDV